MTFICILLLYNDTNTLIWAKLFVRVSRYYERRFRQLGHKMVARRLCQKWPHSRGHYYAHLWAFLHPRSQLLKVDSPKIEENMNEHLDTPICGDKSNFVGSKVTPLAGSPLWWFLLTFASEASTPILRPFWQQVWRSPGNHFMPQLAVPSFIVLYLDVY